MFRHTVLRSHSLGASGRRQAASPNELVLVCHGAPGLMNTTLSETRQFEKVPRI